MILDAEVLLIDTKSSKPLPFGTLGIHKVRKNFFIFPLTSHCCHTSNPFLPSESSLSRRQRVPFCLRLHLLQWREPHGAVRLSPPHTDTCVPDGTMKATALIQLCTNPKRFSAGVFDGLPPNFILFQLVFLGSPVYGSQTATEKSL